MSFEEVSTKINHFNQYILPNLQTQINDIIEEFQALVVNQANKGIREKNQDFVENYENFAVTIISIFTNSLRKEMNKIDLLKEIDRDRRRVIRTTVIRKLHKLPDENFYNDKNPQKNITEDEKHLKTSKNDGKTGMKILSKEEILDRNIKAISSISNK